MASWEDTMAPAARWIVGIVLGLFAVGLWTYWNGGTSQALSRTSHLSRRRPPRRRGRSAGRHGHHRLHAAAAAEEPVSVALYFDFDRSGLRADEKPKLDALVAKVKGRKYNKLEAVGHADRIGEEPYNDQLSKSARRRPSRTSP
jgi:outer membrane protein OmpA-like peptidoglycan-associated protein